MALRTKWASPGHAGRWFDAANWTHGVPSQDQRAIFKGGGTYSVSLGGRSAHAASMVVARDHLTLTDGRLRLAAGGGAADLAVRANASLTIANDAAVSTAGSIVIGTTWADGPSSTTGTILVDGALRTGYLDIASGLVDVAAGASLTASAGIDVTPWDDLGIVSSYATLSIAGQVATSVINSEHGTISLDGSLAHLTAVSCVTNGALTLSHGAAADIRSVQLGYPLGTGFGSLLVDGGQTRLTADTINVGPGEGNGSLTVQNGGSVTAGAINFAYPETDAYITVSGANSSISAGTLAFGTYDNSDILQIVQNGTVSVGSGGLTLNDGTLALDSSGQLSTPFIVSQGGAIDALAGGEAGTVVTIAAPITLGFTTDIHRGITTLQSEAGATLTVGGAITGAAGTVLDIGGGDVILGNAADAYDATRIHAGQLEIAATGAAGAGSLAFLNDAGTSASLVIDAGASFSNIIAGFSNPDSIDLRGFAFMIGISDEFSAGTLTLQNGSATASMTFAGDYVLANFVLQSDGHGGTVITYHV